jgi:hypothetical protein
MYSIELTRGVAWDAPALEVHPVQGTMHIVDVERLAQTLLYRIRRTSNILRPTNYRIRDQFGKCLPSRSATIRFKKSGEPGVPIRLEGLWNVSPRGGALKRQSLRADHREFVEINDARFAQLIARAPCFAVAVIRRPVREP